MDALPEDYKTTLTRFTEAQLDAYEEAQGWIFWCWKTESAPEVGDMAIHQDLQTLTHHSGISRISLLLGLFLNL